MYPKRTRVKGAIDTTKNGPEARSQQRRKHHGPTFLGRVSPAIMDYLAQHGLPSNFGQIIQ